MPFHVFLDPEAAAGLTPQEIADAEQKLGIRLPETLRQLYLQHNGCYLRSCVIDGEEMPLCSLYPLYTEGKTPLGENNDLSVALLLEWQERDGFIPMQYVPFCDDDAGDIYYYSTENGAVYYIMHEFFDEFEADPESCRVADSLEAFDAMIVAYEDEDDE